MNEETFVINQETQEQVKEKKPRKKRTLKPKQVEPINNAELQDEEPKIPKKRGRKPKGGKVIPNNNIITNHKTHEPNIILHLKCGESDLIQNTFISSLQYEPNVPVVETFQFESNKSSDLGYCVINDNNDTDNTNDTNNTNNTNNMNNANNANNTNNTNNTNDSMLSLPEYNNNNNKVESILQHSEAQSNFDNITNENNQGPIGHDTDINTIQLWNKLKELTINLHTNNISDKKAACFWCTYAFDNPPILIPRHELNDMYHCYGCFCSPECATAYLFEEPIDTSTRFERYHLLNHIYCKIYEYNKNIKPAPNPYYTLDKYYGNLSIQEYRKLLKNERLLLVVEKPLSRILPELHEDNDDYILNGSTITTANKFKIRRKTKQTKTDILSDTFNMK